MAALLSPWTALRGLWRRRLMGPVVQQLTQGVTPEMIALTLALGSAISLFPILGTTTVLCAIVGVALRMNQPIIQGVNLLCGIIFVPVLVIVVRLGDRLAGTAPSSLDVPAMLTVFRYHPVLFFHQFGVTALHGVLGWAVLVPIWIPLVYYGTRPLLRGLLKQLKPAAERTAP